MIQSYESYFQFGNVSIKKDILWVKLISTSLTGRYIYKMNEVDLNRREEFIIVIVNYHNSIMVINLYSFNFGY